MKIPVCLRGKHTCVWAEHTCVWAEHTCVWAEHTCAWAEHTCVWAEHWSVITQNLSDSAETLHADASRRVDFDSFNLIVVAHQGAELWAKHCGHSRISRIQLRLGMQMRLDA